MNSQSRTGSVRRIVSALILIANLVYMPLAGMGQVPYDPPTAVRPAPNVMILLDGLRTVTFDTLQGTVTVNLPDDMRAGDTISGTVMAEPKGQTKEERAKNLALLGDYFYVNPGRFAQGEVLVHIDVTTTPFTVNVPTGTGNDKGAGQMKLALKGKDGSTIQTANVPFAPPIGFVITVPNHIAPPIGFVITGTNHFVLPTIGQQGRPVEVTGPFDNRMPNWALQGVQEMNKNEVAVEFGFLAASPRKAVFRAPTNVTGPMEITLNEGGKQKKGTYRNVGVNLSAPKTTLFKGEVTYLEAHVTGLQGITAPVPLTLTCSGVITMQGGPYQQLTIQPSQVGVGGTYTTTREITGVQAGGWGATATVMTQPFNIVLRDPSPPQTILVNSFTGDYIFCGTGPKLTGTGTIKRSGCMFELTDNRPDRQVHGTFDSCVPVNNGITVYSPGANTEIKLTVTDTQLPKRKVYFNPLSKAAPAVTDTSAFATCP